MARGYYNTRDPKTGAVGWGLTGPFDEEYYQGKWTPYAKETAFGEVRRDLAARKRDRDASTATTRWYASDEYKKLEAERSAPFRRAAAIEEQTKRELGGEISESRRANWAKSEFGRLGYPPSPSNGNWKWEGSRLGGKWVRY